VESAGKIEAAQFLRDLVLAAPYRIHIVLTDNGIQFTNRCTTSTPSSISSAGYAASLAAAVPLLQWLGDGIEHRLA
jgi:hypothetical protein